MSAAMPLREDFNADALRRLARTSREAGQSRRLMELASIYVGCSRTDAAQIGAVGLKTVRDWVVAFNAQGPAGLIDCTAPGAPLKLDAAQRRTLTRVIKEGSDPDLDGVVRWRLNNLATWGNASFRISLDESTVGRTVKELGFRNLSVRPRHHEQDPAALTAFKKTSPPP